MLNVTPAGDHQHVKFLFTWLVMSLMVAFCAVFFPLNVLVRSGTKLSQFLRVFLPSLLDSLGTSTLLLGQTRALPRYFSGYSKKRKYIAYL